jgi:hypothetical protein
MKDALGARDGERSDREAGNFLLEVAHGLAKVDRGAIEVVE